MIQYFATSHLLGRCLVGVVTGLVATVTAQAQSTPPTASSPAPHWISLEAPVDSRLPAGQRVARVERDIDVPSAVSRATIKVAADFCTAKILLNGKPLATIEPYSSSVELDVTTAILPGANRWAIEWQAIDGPSAVAASFAVVDALPDSRAANKSSHAERSQAESSSNRNPGLPQRKASTVGQKRTIVTDRSWRGTWHSHRDSEPPQTATIVDRGEVLRAWWGLDRRSAALEPIENYEQWRKAESGTSLTSDQFWVVDGFEVTPLRSALPEEGSWVSMAFDPQGRLTLAREEKGLLRLTLSDDREKIDRVEVIDDSLLECRGLLYAHNALYASANRSKGLYRLRDLDGDGRFEEQQLWRSFAGGVGHGRNDIALGADGSISLIHGDSVDLPTDSIADRTSPFRDRLRASKVGQGHLIRTDATGSEWEIVCAGLRNPFGIAVNQLGDWFTYDADAEFDMGSPWYRPTRVVHLVSGADYGWRAVTGKWPPYFPDHPDNAMPVVDIGKGSPTAVLFMEQSSFPPPYRQALFILDWTYGRVLAVHLVPRGASYRADAETFLQGRPLNVTDGAIGPDGALYLITGGRKTQSTLYRVRYRGPQITDQPLSLHEQEATAHAALAREARKGLEKLHAPVSWSDENWQSIENHLDAEDWTLQHAARTAMEHQPLDRRRPRVLAETRTAAFLEGALALVRSDDRSSWPMIIDRMLLLEVDGSMSNAWKITYVYGLMAEHDFPVVERHRERIGRQVEEIMRRFDRPDPTLARLGSSRKLLGECRMLLAKLQWPGIIATTLDAMGRSVAQEERLHGLLALRQVNEGWTLETHRLYLEFLNEGDAYIRGEGMKKFLAQLRDETRARMSPAEQASLVALLEPAAAVEATVGSTAEQARQRPLVRRWTMEELLPELTKSEHAPDRQRGLRVFQEAACATCHRRGARGPAVGPDLSFVSSRFSRQDILSALIEPSKVVAENYRSVQVVTVDGRAIEGRVVIEGDYRSEKLLLATDPLHPHRHVEIDKAEIESLNESPVSPMPAGLLDSFQAHEILDLLEYLASGAIEP